MVTYRNQWDGEFTAEVSYHAEDPRLGPRSEDLLIGRYNTLTLAQYNADQAMHNHQEKLKRYKK